MSLHSLSGYSIKACQLLEVHMSLHSLSDYLIKACQ